MLSKFYCKVYFDLECLRFFYNKKPKEIMDFHKKVNNFLDTQGFVSVYSVEGYRKLCGKFKNLNKFKNKIFRDFKKDIGTTIALKIFYLNYILLDKFIGSDINISEKSIKQFLIDNLSHIDCITILSTHEFYKSSEHFKKIGFSPHPLVDAIFGLKEPSDFIINNFDQLFLNDEGYALSIFIFLDGIAKKYGLSEKLGIFKEIYLKGKEIMEKEYTKGELKEVVKYHIKKKEEARDFV